MSEVQVPVAVFTTEQKPNVSFLWGISTVLSQTLPFLCVSVPPLLAWPWLTACCDEILANHSPHRRSQTQGRDEDLDYLLGASLNPHY